MITLLRKEIDQHLKNLLTRGFATQNSSAYTFSRERAAKDEGDITSVFLSSTENKPPLPARFSDLKKELWKDSFVESWHGVLEALREKTGEVARKGSSVSRFLWYTRGFS